MSRIRSVARRVKRLLIPPPDPQTVTYAGARRWRAMQRASITALIAAAAPHVPRDGLILDVGANLGQFSRMLMDEIGFRGVAHLFEPVPNLATLCRQTFADARYNVHVHEFGLSDAAGDVTIYTASDGNLGWNTVVEGNHHSGMKTLLVRMCCYDDLGIGAPSFIKIDVEGAEYQVLGGMLGTLRAAPRLPPILCEIGWGQRHPRWNDELGVFDEVLALGYRTEAVDGHPIDIRSLTATTDVFLVPTTPP